MSRRKAAKQRTILPDPLFGSELIAKFINTVMRRGKKSIASRIVYGSFDIVAQRVAGKKQNSKSVYESDEARKVALETFEKALEKVTPTVEVKSRRVGGSNYQVPVEIRAKRRIALAMRWLTDYAAERGEKSMVQRLAAEILDALEDRGGAVKKREDVHRMAKANQAFAHFRW